jgi:hypothetical protein
VNPTVAAQESLQGDRGNVAGMDRDLGGAFVGWLFVIATAVGFLLEYWWLFLAGQLLLLVWVGAQLLGGNSQRT